MPECIYNFEEQPQKQIPKKKIYQSKYDPSGPLLGSTFGMQGTTAVEGKGFKDLKESHHISQSFLGIKSQAPNPKEFLRKGTREIRNEYLLNSLKHHERSKQVIKPPVPTQKEKPLQGLVTSRNFVKTNISDAINSAPNRKKESIPFMKREEFGKIPAYLDSVKREVEYEKNLIKGSLEDKLKPTMGGEGKFEGDFENGDGIIMDEGERLNLINKLKQKWDDINTMYQKEYHKTILHTIAERNRRQSQEAQLKQLEEDIELLTSKGPLVIKSDPKHH